MALIKPKVLVTGAGGLVGGRLAHLLSQTFPVVAARHVAPGPEGVAETVLDLTSPGSIVRILEECRPDVVLHCAALADADRCEKEPGLAEDLNVRSTESLARLCDARAIRLVAVSTDLVFRGDRPFSSENDDPGPLMTYARTKLEGEETVLGFAAGSAVVRIALVHGRGHGPRPTASESIAWTLRAGGRPRLFTDQYRTPIDAESIASAIGRLLEVGGRGRYHLGGPERLSRYELGLRVARVLGFPADLIEAARMADQAQAAPRPPDVSLDSARAKRELCWQPRPIEEGIREGRRGPT